jgi:acetyl-CoA carboxylase carboxyltransferase component
MGPEGAVRLGYRKELEAQSNPAARETLFEDLLARLYEVGKATEAASFLEIDAVIDPADTRAVVLRALAAARVHA